MEEQDKVLPKGKVVATLEAVVDENIRELENELLPKLGHGEVKRLFIAVSKYPKYETDFSNEQNPALIRAYSASKELKDALVGLATEVVIERIIKQQMEAEKATAEEVKDA